MAGIRFPIGTLVEIVGTGRKGTVTGRHVHAKWGTTYDVRYRSSANNWIEGPFSGEQLRRRPKPRKTA